jgi:ubiquinone biosynthesis protein
VFRLARLLKILWVAYRFGLDEFPLAADRTGRLQRWVNRLLFFRRLREPRAVRLRRARLT